jgi:hypothetical protein
MRTSRRVKRRSSLRRLSAPALLAGAVTLILLVVASAADPRASARADGGLISGAPDPGDVLDLVGDIGGGAAVGGMKSILEQLFGGIQSKLTTAVLQYLVKIPDFTGGHVAELSTRMTVMAVAMVGVVATVSIIRYSAAGLLGGSDASAGLEGLMRTAGAALLVLAWAPLFRALVQVANGASTAVLGGSQADLAELFRAAIVGHFALGGPGWIISIVIALAGSMMLLALIALKVAISLTTVLLFVVMPMAIVVSAVPEMAWVGNLAMRALLTCLAIPFIWVSLFATAGAVGLDTLTFSGGGGLLDRSIIKPLVGIVLLFLSLSIPSTLMKAAMMGAGPGGGLVSRAASYAAGRSLYDGVSQAWDGATSQDGNSNGAATGGEPSGPPQRFGEGQQWAAPVLTAAEKASASAGAPWATAALAVGAEAAKAMPDGSQSQGGQRPADSDGPASKQSSDPQSGWAPPTPPGSGSAKDGGAAASEFTPTRFNPERFQAEHGAAQARAQSSPPSQQETAEAIEALSPAQQAWAQGQIADHADNPDMQARHMAHAAASEGLAPQERDAFRTLAASEGLSEHFAATTGNGTTAADTSDGSPVLSLPSDPDDPANSAFGLGTTTPQGAQGANASDVHVEVLGNSPTMPLHDLNGDASDTADEGRNPFKD